MPSKVKLNIFDTFLNRGVFHETGIYEIAVFLINSFLENTDPISQNKIALFGVLFRGSVFQGFWLNISPNSNQDGRSCCCRSSS